MRKVARSLNLGYLYGTAVSFCFSSSEEGFLKSFMTKFVMEGSDTTCDGIGFLDWEAAGEQPFYSIVAATNKSDTLVTCAGQNMKNKAQQ